MKQFLYSLKYLLVLSLPILVIISLNSNGWLTFLPLLEAFVLIPIVELFIKPDPTNLSEESEAAFKKAWIFDFWIYVAVLLHLGVLIYFFFSISEEGLSSWEYAGRISSVGLMCGIYGINIAHELGHRPEKYQHWISKLLLMTSLYMHFFVEHNRGHHRYVSTPKDPATSRRNEMLYAFWFRSIVGSYVSAWKLEIDRMKKMGLSAFSLSNEMIMYHFIQIGLLVFLFFLFGTKVLIAFVIAATMGILLLETVNYIEHYGLLRKEVAPDRYERVLPRHSWNSDHILGRMLLFELSRHSDHHYLASRKYQVLRHMEGSPQMPTGYPGMILLALLPPLWFYIMHNRMQSENAIVSN